MLPAIKKNYPNLFFIPSNRFVWSPKKQTIYYNQEAIGSAVGALALLHELSHAILNHKTYEYDIELLNMEVEAWEKAKELAIKYSIEITESHIQSCLETYRIWLYKRSLCPSCANTSIQQNESTYMCFNCNSSWRVAQSHSLHPRRMNLISLAN